MAKVRVRIAPSPTGFAHVGIAYAALFNLAFAQKNQGKFIIRIEDTDVKRHVPEAEEAIFKDLSWLGLSWDEGPDKGGKFGPYRQSERLKIYQEKAEELLDSGKAYPDAGAVRFKNPGRDLNWEDLIRGKISFPGGEVTDFVILKSDGYPTYNFAVVVDDILMRITHVIRGEEHISNTPRQLALYKAFETQPPKFAHLPTLRGADRKKLSKRRDPVDLRIYREEGYLPEALVNFLCLLGWSHPQGKEIFPLSEFIRFFDLKKVRKAGPVFDIKKLDWMNGVYIRKKTGKQLVQLIKPFVPGMRPSLIKKTAPLLRERVNKLSEIKPLVGFFLEEPKIDKKELNRKNRAYLLAALASLEACKAWSHRQIEKVLRGLAEEKDWKTAEFFMSLRIAVTGKKVGLPLIESLEILGKEKTLARIRKALK